MYLPLTLTLYVYVKLAKSSCLKCRVKNVYYVIATNSNSVPEVHDM